MIVVMKAVPAVIRSGTVFFVRTPTGECAEKAPLAVIIIGGAL